MEKYAKNILILLAILFSTAAAQAQQPSALIGRWNVEFSEAKEKAVYEIKKERRKLLGYAMFYIDKAGKQYPDYNLILTDITSRGKNISAAYQLEYGGKKYKAECTIKFITRDTLELTYNYWGHKDEESWTRIDRGFGKPRQSPAIHSTTLRFEIPDGTVHALDVAECTDPIMRRGVQVGKEFCLCQGVAFRIAQLIEAQWNDRVFHVNDARIVTGWKTDGPKEFFVDKLGMNEDVQKGFSYNAHAKEPADQHIEDVWYEVTILSKKKTFLINATESLYGKPDQNGKTFLDYRREVKGGGNPEHKLKVNAMRADIADKIKAKNFAAGAFRIVERLPPFS